MNWDDHRGYHTLRRISPPHPLHTHISRGVDPKISLEIWCCLLPMGLHCHKSCHSEHALFPLSFPSCFLCRQFQEFLRNLLHFGSLFTSEVNFPHFSSSTHLIKLQKASQIHNIPSPTRIARQLEQEAFDYIWMALLHQLQLSLNWNWWASRAAINSLSSPTPLSEMNLPLRKQ